MERSGTHWVAALLNSHLDIACFPTLPFYNEVGEQRVGEMHFFNTLASLEGESEDKFTRPFSDFETKTRSHTLPKPQRTAKALQVEAFRLILPFLDKRENPKRKLIRLVGVRIEKLA